LGRREKKTEAGFLREKGPRRKTSRCRPVLRFTRTWEKEASPILWGEEQVYRAIRKGQAMVLRFRLSNRPKRRGRMTKLRS